MCRIGFLLALSAALVAAEETLTLEFAAGGRKQATLLACDDAGLTVRMAGKRRILAWKELAPRSAYEARKALTPYEDGPDRLTLAAFARELRLYPEAIEQLEIAQALGAVDEAGFEKLSREIAKEEVWFLTANIETLLRSKAAPGLCLAAIKRLKERYPNDPANAKYAPEIKRLVALQAKKLQAQQDQLAAGKESQELRALRALVEKWNARKVAAIEKAGALVTRSKPAIQLRQVSRVKRLLVEPLGAERYYKRARTALREMARLDTGFRIVTREGLRKEYDAIEKKLIDCYLQVARILMQERNYKGAKDYVAKILLYDPIHEEALDMVKEIRAHRIHFKLSDITNARPRVTGG